MNILKSFALCFLTATFAFAQVPPLEEQPAPTPVPVPAPVSLDSLSSLGSSSSSSIALEVALPQPATSSSSAAEVIETKQPAPEGKTIFDSLRGHAYNPYSTAGASSTVGDLVTRPSDIYGQQFFYVSPTDLLGYVAFSFDGGSALFGLDRSPLGNLAALVLGYANSTFGLALNYSVSKLWLSDASSDLRYTAPGDNIGLYFSLPAGSETFYANASWLTYSRSEDLDFENGKYSRTFDYSEINGNIGLTGNSGSLAYDLYLNVLRTGDNMTIDGEDLIDAEDPTYWALSFNFDLGYTVLKNSNARVIIGANSYFYDIVYDKTKGESVDSKIGFVTVPTILAEVSLFDNWLAFAGAGHVLSLRTGDGDGDSDTSLLEIKHSDGSGAFAGIRYQRANWAVEAQISANMFNNPFGGFSDRDMFVGFGGFIYF